MNKDKLQVNVFKNHTLKNPRYFVKVRFGSAEVEIYDKQTDRVARAGVELPVTPENLELQFTALVKLGVEKGVFEDGDGVLCIHDHSESK